MLIAIPSKSRPFRSKSKDLLTQGVMYVPACEFDAYKRVYSDVVAVPDEVKGITATRNWILKNTDERWVLFIDDDLKNQGRFFAKPNGYGLTRRRMTEAEWMTEFERLFELTESLGWKIFGVNTESRIMSGRVDKPFIFRQYVLGSCMGMVNDGSLYFDEEFKTKEDYEVSLRHIQQFGGVLRARYLYFENTHWGDDGGCKDYRTDQLERAMINKLIQRYPKFIRKITNKSSQYGIQLHFED